jgi:hypothetical protein
MYSNYDILLCRWFVYYGMQAITEEGQIIKTCVDCEKWIEETDLFGIHDRKTGELSYHLCEECYREDLKSEKDW